MNKVDFYISWEDFYSVQEALNVVSSDTVITITSGGCNVFNLLLCNPKKVISLDYNPYQKYLMELKIAAIRNLDYSGFLEIMGVKPSSSRLEHYDTILKHLSDEAKEFWDQNKFPIESGLLYAGENNVKFFGKLLRFLKGKDTLEHFFNLKTIEEQSDYFYKKIYGLHWKLLLNFVFRNYTSKIVLCLRMLRDYPVKKKRPPEYFRYIQKIRYPKNQREKVENIFTEIPIQDNYFASMIIFNRYINENAFPPYLRKESFNILKERIDRIQLKTITIEEFLKECKNNSITKFNLSNIFDWYSDHEFKTILNEIVRVGANKSKIIYSVTRSDRAIPDNITELTPDKKLAMELSKKDRTMMYSNYEIAEIQK